MKQIKINLSNGMKSVDLSLKVSSFLLNSNKWLENTCLKTIYGNNRIIIFLEKMLVRNHKIFIEEI